MGGHGPGPLPCSGRCRRDLRRAARLHVVCVVPAARRAPGRPRPSPWDRRYASAASTRRRPPALHRVGAGAAAGDATLTLEACRRAEAARCGRARRLHRGGSAAGTPLPDTARGAARPATATAACAGRAGCSRVARCVTGVLCAWRRAARCAVDARALTRWGCEQRRSSGHCGLHTWTTSCAAVRGRRRGGRHGERSRSITCSPTCHGGRAARERASPVERPPAAPCDAGLRTRSTSSTPAAARAGGRTLGERAVATTQHELDPALRRTRWRRGGARRRGRSVVRSCSDA
jgi:hypothetical protein